MHGANGIAEFGLRPDSIANFNKVGKMTVALLQALIANPMVMRRLARMFRYVGRLPCATGSPDDGQKKACKKHTGRCTCHVPVAKILWSQHLVLL